MCVCVCVCVKGGGKDFSSGSIHRSTSLPSDQLQCVSVCVCVCVCVYDRCKGKSMVLICGGSGVSWGNLLHTGSHALLWFTAHTHTHTHTRTPPLQFHLPKSHLPFSLLLFGLHQRQYQFTVYEAHWNVTLHSLAASLSFSHTHSHTFSPSVAHLLALFIVVQVIKRQAAPRWQEGGEDCREGQGTLTTTHCLCQHTHTHTHHHHHHHHTPSVLLYSMSHIFRTGEGSVDVQQRWWQIGLRLVLCN